MTEIIKIVGKAYWTKLYEPETAFGQTSYKLDLVPESPEEWKKFKDSGIQKTVKKDVNNAHDGADYFNLVRPAFKMIKGGIINFTGPIVEDESGGVIVDYTSKMTGKRVYSYDASKKDDVERRGSPILVGNGSRVEVSIAVYDTQKGKGHRFEKVRILDLIEYKRDDTPPPLSHMVTGGDYEVEKPRENKVLDDDIPF